MSAPFRVLKKSQSFVGTFGRKVREEARRSARSLFQQASRALDKHSRPLNRYVHPSDLPYSAAANVANDLSVLDDRFTGAGVEWVRLPGLSRFRPTVVVDVSQKNEVLSVVEALRTLEGWRIRYFDTSGRHITSAAAGRLKVGAVATGRAHFSSDGIEISSSDEDIMVEFWDRLPADVPRDDGTTYETGTLRRGIQKRGPLVEYLTPDQWATGIADGNCIRLPYPHLFEVTGPIDIVYTWVNGDDPDWRRRKNKAQGILDHETVNETAVNSSRFNNRNELKYSLRSLEMYASWVNHIFLVTDQQVPEWLDTDHPGITVVDHREIFTDTSALPVFNSHAIESQLHHIPGLSEQYVYMNDDIVFLRPTEASLFFHGNGQAKFYPSTAPLDLAPSSARDLPVLSAAKHNRELIERTFQRTITNKLKHTPHAQLKSVLEQLEADNSEIFSRLSHSTFRHPDDLSITSALHHWYAYGLGKATPANIRYGYVNVAADDAEQRLAGFARSRRFDVLCVNETETTTERAAEIDVFLGEFFRKRFPFKSSFEK